MSGGRERFSPSAYSARIRLSMPEEHEPGALMARNAETAAVERGASDAAETAPAKDFKRLAEEMRAYLAAPRGMTEEERKEYGEKLNRAVLGYLREREEILALISDRLIRLRIHQLPGGHRQYQTLAEALFAEVIGLGVLELLLREKEGLEEIQVVGTRIFEVRRGTVSRSSYSFESEKEVERIQQNLVLYNNDRINPRKRWAEVMLRDGSRVTMTGFGFTAVPTLTMRFYTARSFSLESLAASEYGTISGPLLQMLRGVLKARLNVVIIGPTNSGKTHLMKALIAELPEEERIVTLEGRLEMRLGRDFPQRNIIEYEMEEDDPMHRSAQAFKLALRQSPERIVHAEIRDEDANIYVRACTRGHSGSMTTVHASALEDVPEAVTDMCMLDNRGMNPERLVKRIAEYVTQVGIEMRIAANKRRIVRLGELRWEEGEVRVRDWAVFNETDGKWIYPEPPPPAVAAYMAAGREKEG
ncbi:ATPase, T2SS/T4P/T4SS family [Paenibacillus beijingensis]|uniref:Secretion system protein E n=1 Tax=Paenibacillus beijingensis TaxID=1126833 RepID=A0A0D5NG18_9BACL|nr:ATPase, T2SS/T4P/T4SS family [Paenibacillus beijingensis]AJY73858.1 secretion system protein E [Paenibacillus beijingensis]